MCSKVPGRARMTAFEAAFARIVRANAGSHPHRSAAADAEAAVRR